MTDIVKWTLLLTGLLLIISMIVALPIIQIINVDQLTSAVAVITDNVAYYIQMAKGFINWLFPAAVRPLLTYLLAYTIGKPIVLFIIHITTGIYHYFFK